MRPRGEVGNERLDVCCDVRRRSPRGFIPIPYGYRVAQDDHSLRMADSPLPAAAPVAGLAPFGQGADAGLEELIHANAQKVSDPIKIVDVHRPLAGQDLVDPVGTFAAPPRQLGLTFFACHKDRMNITCQQEARANRLQVRRHAIRYHEILGLSAHK